MEHTSTPLTTPQLDGSEQSKQQPNSLHESPQGEGQAQTFRVPQSVPQAVKPGEKRSKKGKRKATVIGQPPALRPEDYVRVVPVPKRTEVLHEGWRPVSLSNLDKAPQIELEKGLKSATFRKGYRTVRATHGACEGTWYFEAQIQHLGASGHARLGWSTRKGELQAPVGYDEYSFAYRDLEGVKVHQALREDYGEPFQEGDVIGCYLHLGSGGRPFEKERSDIVTWKGGLYFTEDPAAGEPKPLQGSVVAFTKNGKPQGVAFRDFVEGTYYPALSLYTLPNQSEGASVSVNFGPDFAFEPPQPDGCPPAQAISTLAGDPPQVPPPMPPQALLTAAGDQGGADAVLEAAAEAPSSLQLAGLPLAQA